MSIDYDRLAAQIVNDVHFELNRAIEAYPTAFHSAHEAFAFMDEERDELWEQVKVKQGERDVAKMRSEAIQVAAMAIRFVLDVCDSDRGQR